MGSTRLPRKVLMDLGGKPVLKWVFDAAKAAKLVHHVVVATPDYEIVEFCDANEIPWSMGPEDDVLERFIIAAEHTRATKIIRLTADCPFLDPEIIDQCILLNESAVDEWPDGMDVQVIDPRWLPMGDREHVVPVKNNLPQLACPVGNMRHVRVTLDTPEDLERCRTMAKFLPKNRPPKWRETISAHD